MGPYPDCQRSGKKFSGTPHESLDRAMVPSLHGAMVGCPVVWMRPWKWMTLDWIISMMITYRRSKHATMGWTEEVGCREHSGCGDGGMPGYKADRAAPCIANSSSMSINQYQVLPTNANYHGSFFERLISSYAVIHHSIIF